MEQKKEYTVKEIAQMLSTNEETVRRWIRDGKLESESSSRKGGHRVSSESFTTFLHNTPKYGSILGKGATFGATLGATIGATSGLALPLIVAGIAGGTVVDALSGGKTIEHTEASNKSEEDVLPPSVENKNLIPFLERQIKDMEEKVERTQLARDALSDQLQTLRSQLDTYKMQLEICKRMEENEHV